MYMKHNAILLLAALTLLAACKPGETTIKGSYPSADNAPETVDIMVGNNPDIFVDVVNGQFEAKIPTDVAVLSYIISENQPLMFIADGSTLTVDFVEKTVSSSDKNGVNSRLNAHNEWEQQFMKDFRAKMEGLSEEEQEECSKEAMETYNTYLRQLVKDNPDNVLGVMGIDYLETEDPKEKLDLLNSLSANMREQPTVAALIESLESGLATVEGEMFKDFTVVQDPDNAEESTVKLSDYVGKGKFIILDFWASWCEPCKEEAPYLRAVYEKYKGDRFDMVSVAINDIPMDTAVTAKELGITWNQIVNAREEVAMLYGIQYIPHIILFGPDGTILKRNLRGEEIDAAVAEALAE